MNTESMSHSVSQRQSIFAEMVRLGEFYAIYLVNILLTVLTLGIYRFWGKTRERRYMWSRLRVLDEPLSYTGTGGELFKGFFIAFVLVLLPLSLLYTWLLKVVGMTSNLAVVLQLFYYALLLFLIGFAIYRAQRFRLSRTTWRGMRGGLGGSASTYGGMNVAAAVGASLTLGWLWPLMQMKMMHYRLNNTAVGSQNLAFSAAVGPVYKRYALFWLALVCVGGLVVGTLEALNAGLDAPVDLESMTDEERQAFVLGAMVVPFAVWGGLILGFLIYQLYRGWLLSYVVRHVSFMGAKLTSTITAWNFLWLMLGNGLIMVSTLLLGYPVVMKRKMAYMAKHVHLDGEVDVEQLFQNAEGKPKRGEGFAEAFDVGEF